MRSPTVSTKLQRIAEQAVQYPERVFTTLAHLIDEEFLREAFRRTRKDAAPGADGITAKHYGENLEENLRDLHTRLRGGSYKAPPVKRTWIEKEDGSKRPIGIPEFEDKVVQRAVAMVLGAVYEQDFHDFSYGFRQGRNPHQALRELHEQCWASQAGWILDADVSGFFDDLPHGEMREILQKRVNDGGLVRLIGKWLNAGVLEDGQLTYPEKGTPQGGVISPMLSNIFLHHVLDEWYEHTVKPRMRGRTFLIRFADDFVIGFEREDDARRVKAVLAKRFGRFGLTIHPTKTALVAFQRPERAEKGKPKARSFDFLGFTHYWAKSRRGNWVIKRKTASKKLRRSMTSLWQWCRANRHKPLAQQHRTLSSKLRGHYQYYGIRDNYRALAVVKEHVKHSWRYWLSRRSHKGYLTWDKFERLCGKLPLPKPRIVHSTI